MGLLGSLIGIRGGKAKPVAPPDTTAGALAIREQLRRAAEQGQRNALALAASRRGGGLALINAQNRGAQLQQQALDAGNQAELQLRQAANEQGFQAKLQAQQLEEQRKAANAAAVSKFAGAALSGGATLGASALAKPPPPPANITITSDENRKREIKKGEAAAEGFLRALAETFSNVQPKSFEMDAGLDDGKGRQVGVLAQALQRAGPMGEAMVEETPEGKGIDVQRGLSGVLAGQADHESRLSALEKALKR